MQIKSPKKLIEVALPLDDINAAAAREKPRATRPPDYSLEDLLARAVAPDALA
jgi:adenine-specific DNA methylase